VDFHPGFLNKSSKDEIIKGIKPLAVIYSNHCEDAILNPESI
jgi:hypothetical protein